MHKYISDYTMLSCQKETLLFRIIKKSHDNAIYSCRCYLTLLFYIGLKFTHGLKNILYGDVNGTYTLKYNNEELAYCRH